MLCKKQVDVLLERYHYTCIHVDCFVKIGNTGHTLHKTIHLIKTNTFFTHKIIRILEDNSCFRVFVYTLKKYFGYMLVNLPSSLNDLKLFNFKFFFK